MVKLLKNSLILLTLLAQSVICVAAPNVLNYIEQGGSASVIGGTLTIVSGGTLTGDSGSTVTFATCNATTFVGNISGNATTATNALQWSGTSTNLVAATGRSSLGLDSMSLQASNNVAISGGTITGVTITNSAIAATTASASTTNSTAIIWGDNVIGEIASTYNAIATILPTLNVYVTVTADCYEIITKNATVSTTNGTITVLKSGKYWVVARVSGLSGNTNDVVHFGISVNGAKPSGYYESEFTLLAASGKGGQSAGGIINLSANDTVSCKIENATAGNNITIKFFNLSLFRILD